jgi:hypothetical protein
MHYVDEADEKKDVDKAGFAFKEGKEDGIGEHADMRDSAKIKRSLAVP